MYNLDALDTPAAIVDLSVVKENIAKMISGLTANGIAHRPHFKAHKSLYFAKMQIEMGAIGMTCAKLGEAEVLLGGGINDILVAYPIIGGDKLLRLIALSQRAKVRTVINSLEGAKALGEAFAARGLTAGVLIELEGGMGRSPVTLSNIADFARAVMPMDGIHIDGIMSYCGTIYTSRDEAECIEQTKQESAQILMARDALSTLGLGNLILSTGSSYSGKYAKYLQGVTEVRAGNYIFNDVSQLACALVAEQNCALRVLTTVVTLPTENTAVIDAGSKTLSSDTTAHGQGYGRIAGHQGVYAYKLSEEHGYLKIPEGTRFHIGQRLSLIPNHACVLPNLTGELYVVDGEKILTVSVEARGKNR